MFDHFGLDYPDIEKYDYDIFIAWFILQHFRGYKPYYNQNIIYKQILIYESFFLSANQMEFVRIINYPDNFLYAVYFIFWWISLRRMDSHKYISFYCRDYFLDNC